MASIKKTKIQITGDTSEAQKAIKDIPVVAEAAAKKTQDALANVSTKPLLDKINQLSTSINNLNRAIKNLSNIDTKISQLSRAIKPPESRGPRNPYYRSTLLPKQRADEYLAEIKRSRGLDERIRKQFEREQKAEVKAIEKIKKNTAKAYSKGIYPDFEATGKFIEQTYARNRKGSVFPRYGPGYNPETTRGRERRLNLALHLARNGYYPDFEAVGAKAEDQYLKSLKPKAPIAQPKVDPFKTFAYREGNYSTKFTYDSRTHSKVGSDPYYLPNEVNQNAAIQIAGDYANPGGKGSSLANSVLIKRKIDAALAQQSLRNSILGREDVKGFNSKSLQNKIATFAATHKPDEESLKKYISLLKESDAPLKKQIPSINGIGNAWSRVDGVVKRIFQFYIGTKILNTAKSFLGLVISTQSAVEQTRLGFAETLSVSSRLLDKFTGKELPVPAQIASSFNDAEIAINEIYKTAVNLGLPVTEVQKAFVNSAGAARAAGLNLKDSVKIIGQLQVLALRAQIPPNVLARDVRDIFTGLNVQRTVLGNLLGLNQSMVREAQKQGTLAELLKDRLKLVGETAKSNLSTFEGLAFSIKAIFQDLQRTTGFPIFDELKGALKTFRDFLDELRTSPAAIQGVTNVANSAVATSRKLYAATPSVVGAGEVLLGGYAASKVAKGVFSAYQGYKGLTAAGGIGAAIASAELAPVLAGVIGTAFVLALSFETVRNALSSLFGKALTFFAGEEGEKSIGTQQREDFNKLKYFSSVQDALSTVSKTKLKNKLIPDTITGKAYAILTGDNGIREIDRKDINGNPLHVTQDDIRQALDNTGTFRSGALRPAGVNPVTGESYLRPEDRIENREKGALKLNKLYSDLNFRTDRAANRLTQITAIKQGIKDDLAINYPDQSPIAENYQKSIVKVIGDLTGKTADQFIGSFLIQQKKDIESHAFSESDPYAQDFNKELESLKSLLTEYGLTGLEFLQKQIEKAKESLPKLEVAGYESEAALAKSKFDQTNNPSDLNNYISNKRSAINTKYGHQHDLITQERENALRYNYVDKNAVNSVLQEIDKRESILNANQQTDLNRVDIEAKGEHDKIGGRFQGKDIDELHKTLSSIDKDYRLIIKDSEVVLHSLDIETQKRQLLNTTLATQISNQIELANIQGVSEKGKIPLYASQVDNVINAAHIDISNIDSQVVELQRRNERIKSEILPRDYAALNRAPNDNERTAIQDKIDERGLGIEENNNRINQLLVDREKTQLGIVDATEKWRLKLIEIQTIFVNIGQLFSDSIIGGFDSLLSEGSGSLGGKFLRGVTSTISGAFTDTFKKILKEKLGFDQVIEGNFLKKIPGIFNESGQLSSDNFIDSLKDLGSKVKAYFGGTSPSSNSATSPVSSSGVIDLASSGLGGKSGGPISIPGFGTVLTQSSAGGNTGIDLNYLNSINSDATYSDILSRGSGKGSGGVGGAAGLITNYGKYATIAGLGGQGAAAGSAAAAGAGAAAEAGYAGGASLAGEYGASSALADGATSTATSATTSGAGSALGYLALILAFINGAASANKLATQLRRQPGNNENDILKSGGRASAAGFVGTFIGDNGLSKGIGKILNKIDPILGTENPAGKFVIKNLGLASIKTTVALVSQELKKVFDAVGLPRLEQGTKHGVTGGALGGDIPAEYLGIGGAGGGALFSANYERGFGKGGFDPLSVRNAVVRAGYLLKLSAEDTRNKYRDVVQAEGGSTIDDALIKLQKSIINPRSRGDASGSAHNRFVPDQAQVLDAVKDIIDAYANLPTAIDKASIAQFAFTSNGVLQLAKLKRVIADVGKTIEGVGSYLNNVAKSGDLFSAGQALGDSLVSGLVDRLQERILEKNGAIGKITAKLGTLVNSAAEQYAAGDLTAGHASTIQIAKQFYALQAASVKELAPYEADIQGLIAALGGNAGPGIINQGGIGTFGLHSNYTPTFTTQPGPRGLAGISIKHGEERIRSAEQEDKVLSGVNRLITQLSDTPLQGGTNHFNITIVDSEGNRRKGRVASIERRSSGIAAPDAKIGF